MTNVINPISPAATGTIFSISLVIFHLKFSRRSLRAEKIAYCLRAIRDLFCVFLFADIIDHLLTNAHRKQ